jgi:hypothetical protein
VESDDLISVRKIKERGGLPAVIGYHFPFSCVGHVGKDGSGYRLTPVV